MNWNLAKAGDIELDTFFCWFPEEGIDNKIYWLENMYYYKIRCGSKDGGSTFWGTTNWISKEDYDNKSPLKWHKQKEHAN